MLLSATGPVLLLHIPSSFPVSLGFQRDDSAAQGHLALSEDTFGCHNQGAATGIQWVEVGDAANTLHAQDSPHSKELSRPQCLWCQG